MTPKGVSGLPTTMPRRIAGISSSPAEIIVQLRPPNFATMNVYGNRIVAPTRLGSEMSQNASELLKAKPAAGSITTTMLHSCQTMKPRNSAKIDQREVALGDRAARGLPEGGVLGIPAIDPATGAVGECDGAGGAWCGGICADGVVVVTDVVIAVSSGKV